MPHHHLPSIFLEQGIIDVIASLLYVDYPAGSLLSPLSSDFDSSSLLFVGFLFTSPSVVPPSPVVIKPHAWGVWI